MRAGLEAESNYAWLADMVLEGIPTAADRSSGDDLATKTVLAAFAGRVTVTGDAAVGTRRRWAKSC